MTTNTPVEFAPNQKLIARTRTIKTDKGVRIGVKVIGLLGSVSFDTTSPSEAINRRFSRVEGVEISKSPNGPELWDIAIPPADFGKKKSVFRREWDTAIEALKPGIDRNSEIYIRVAGESESGSISRSMRITLGQLRGVLVMLDNEEQEAI